MAPGYPGPSTVGVVMGPPGENGVIMASPGMHPHIGPQMELPPGGMMHMNMQGAVVSQAPPQIQGYPSVESSQAMMISPGPPAPMATMVQVQQAPHTQVHSEEAAFHQQQAAAAHAAAQQANNLQQHVAMATAEQPVTIVTTGDTPVLDVIHQAHGTPSSSREQEEQQAAGIVPVQSSEHFSGMTTPCHEAITPEPQMQPPSNHSEGMTPSDMHPHASVITPSSIESQQQAGVIPSPSGLHDSCHPLEEAQTPASVSPALPGPPPPNAQQHAASPQCAMEQPNGTVHCPMEQPSDLSLQTVLHPGPAPISAVIPHSEISTMMETRENNEHLDMEGTTE